MYFLTNLQIRKCLLLFFICVRAWGECTIFIIVRCWYVYSELDVEKHDLFFLPSSGVYDEVDGCVRCGSLLEGRGTCMYVFFYQISSGFVCDDLPL